MSDLRKLKQHVLTFEKSYQSRFPESRRLYNNVVREYATRMQRLQGGAWYEHAFPFKDAYDTLAGKEPSEDAMRRDEEREQFMENVVAPNIIRGYNKVKDATDWTKRKAAKGYRGAKRAYNWAADTWFAGKSRDLLTKLREEAAKKGKKLKNEGEKAICRAAKTRCNMISIKECEQSKKKLLEKIKRESSMRDRIKKRSSASKKRRQKRKRK